MAIDIFKEELPELLSEYLENGDFENAVTTIGRIIKKKHKELSLSQMRGVIIGLQKEYLI
jgi:hypothetical protein